MKEFTNGLSAMDYCSKNPWKEVEFEYDTSVDEYTIRYNPAIRCFEKAQIFYPLDEHELKWKPLFSNETPWMDIRTVLLRRWNKIKIRETNDV